LNPPVNIRAVPPVNNALNNPRRFIGFSVQKRMHHNFVWGAKKVTGTPLAARRYRPAIPKESFMDKDRISGSAKQAKGAVKQAAGKMTGDTKLQAEGAADKAAGKVQNAVGGAKDAIRQTSKH
jgi:uncharacterized protein YjbJ (UPF0337 family)